MAEDSIRWFVEQHSYEAFGMQYSASLEWVAIEEPSDSDEATRCLMRLELNAAYETTRVPMQMHLVVGLSDLSELPAQINDALHRQLHGGDSASAPERPWMPIMQRLAVNLLAPPSFWKRSDRLVH